MKLSHLIPKAIVSLSFLASPLLIAATDSLDEWIPPEYLNIPQIDFSKIVGKPGEDSKVSQSKCKAGFRIGDKLGRDIVAKIGASCSDIILPDGSGDDNEWIIPAYSLAKGTDAATVCTYIGYSRAVELTVLNTARNCAKVLEDTVRLSIQMEYNKCYAEQAQLLGSLNVKFANLSGFTDGDYVLVPEDSSDWDTYLQSLVTTTSADGNAEASPIIKKACALGKLHASKNKKPINYFEGDEEVSSPSSPKDHTSHFNPEQRPSDGSDWNFMKDTQDESASSSWNLPSEGPSDSGWVLPETDDSKTTWTLSNGKSPKKN